MKKEEIEKFEQGLKEEYELYGKLLDLLREELSFAEKEDRDFFISILPKKLELMKLLDEKDNTIKEFKEKWKEEGNKKSSDYENIKILLEKMGEKLKEIITIDEEIQSIYRKWQSNIEETNLKANILRAGKAYGKKD